MNLGILGSGSGSNMQAIHEAISQGLLNAKITIVVSDNPDAYILKRAEAAGIPTSLVDCGSHRSKFPEKCQEQTAQLLLDAKVDLVCLAGFMRLVKKPLLDAFPQRIINIHPSLLPAFPGLEAWKQALEAGVAETGVTVHHVDEGMDTGPIILQESIPVLPNDTPESLHQRLQQVEHQIYPAAIRKLADSSSGCQLSR